MSNSIPILETERLRLRPFTMQDADDVQRLAGDVRVAAGTLLIPHPYPDGAAATWISTHESSIRNGDGFPFAITLKEHGVFVGAMGVHPEKNHRRAELGYWIGVPYWNRGIGTEAARAVINYAFTVLEMHRVHAAVFTNNPASARLLEKVGMKREGLSREHVCKNGIFLDVISFAILRKDWAPLPA